MKKLACLGVSLCAAALLTACATQKTEEKITTLPEQPTQAVANMEQSQTVAAGKTIEPLPSSVDVANLLDCEIHVGFTLGKDLFLEDGKPMLRADVYEQEYFDLVDISQLEVGDSILLAGQTAAVTQLERENGAVLINGGIERGGYTLQTQESGVFYQVSFSDALAYQKVGEAMLPVGQDFQLRDNTDLSQAAQLRSFEELLADGSGTVLQPDNTLARMADGYLVGMEHSYMP